MSKVPKPARRRHPRLSAQSLEERALLSAFVSEFPLPSHVTADAVSSVVDADAQAPDQSAELSVSDGVQVLEIGTADNDGDAGHEIGVIELPEAVVVAVNSRLPGVSIEAAETDAEEGVPRFEVHAEYHGIKLDVTLSPNGEVLEIKQPLEATALPYPLRSWTANRFSGATVLEAEMVAANGSVSYQLLIVTPKQRTIEATLRLADGDSPRLLPTSDSPIGRDAEQHSVAEQVKMRTPSARAVSLANVSPKGPQTAQLDARPATNVAVQRSRDTVATIAADDEKHSDHTDATRSVTVGDISGTTVQVMNLSSTNAPSATTLTLVARVLTDVVPPDLAAIERGLQEFLNGVNSLADMTREDSPARHWLPPLLTVAAGFYGAEHVVRKLRKSRRNPVLAAASHWSWVLNLSTSSDSKER